MKSPKPRARTASKEIPEVRIRGRRVPDFGNDFVVVRTGRFLTSPKTSKTSEETGAMLRKVGSALSRPGISKKAIFKRNFAGVFAYSVDPTEPDKIVRRSIAGKKTVGRLVGRRFKAG